MKLSQSLNAHVDFFGQSQEVGLTVDQKVAGCTIFPNHDFLAAVQELRPRVAVFDCDGTLWGADAGSGFMQWTLEHGLVPAEAAFQLMKQYEGYEAGDVPELAICGEMVQVFAGLQEASVRESAKVFFRDRIAPLIFAEMLELVRALEQAGTVVWVVSSTCNWVIEEGMTRFGIPAERVLAARVEVVDGRITDRLLDVPTDEGKAASLLRAGITKPDAVFGNSVHDAAMLMMGHRAFPVNPTPALLTLCAREGWPVYFPSGAVAPS